MPRQVRWSLIVEEGPEGDEEGPEGPEGDEFAETQTPNGKFSVSFRHFSEADTSFSRRKLWRHTFIGGKVGERPAFKPLKDTVL